jgi:hypothetical protein
LARDKAKHAKKRDRLSGKRRRGLPPTAKSEKPVYRPIHPASQPKNPAMGGKPGRITAKTPF